MAIIKSPVWSEVRGSIGGTTYARNKTGQYARNRSKPVNPNTGNQSRVRSQFQSNAFAFSSLSVAQVLAWNQYAQGYPAINRVGDTYTPSGKQVFITLNQNLLSIGETPISDPPNSSPQVPNIDISGIDIHSYGATVGPVPLSSLQFTGVTSDLATAILIVQATPNLNPARQSYRNRMRQVGQGTQGATIDLLGNWNTYFGTPGTLIGQIINMRIAAVDPATGISSAWVYTSTEIIDVP